MKLRVSKIKALVILSLYLLLSLVTLAETTNNNNTNNVDISGSLYKSIAVAKECKISISIGEGSDLQALQKSFVESLATESDDNKFKCFNEKINAGIGFSETYRNETSCKEAKQEMNRAFSDMVNQCSKANMGSGITECLSQAKACRRCDPNDEESSDECDEDDVGAVETFGANVQQMLMGGRMTPATPDMQKSMKRFSQCPAMASENYEKMQEDVKDSEEKVRDLTTQLHDSQEQANKLAEELQEAENAIQEEMDQLELEIEERIKEIGEKEKKIRQDSEDLAYQIADQINEAEERIRALDLRKHEAQIAYNTKRAEANSKCHQAALDKLKQINSRKQELIQLSQYSAGGFDKLMSSIGLNSREKMRRVVNKYFRECKNDQAFKENMSLLKQILMSEYNKINEEKRMIKSRIATLNRNLEIAKNRLPGELQKLFEELSSYKNQAEKKLTRLQQRLMQTREKFTKAQNNLNQRITQVQTQLQQEQVYLQQKQAYLSLQHSFSGGFASDKGAASEALAAASQAIATTSSVISSCRCSTENPVDKDACQKACNYDTTYTGYENPDCIDYNKFRRGSRSSSGSATRN